MSDDPASGRAIDRAIAEHIFGLTVTEKTVHPPRHDVAWAVCDGDDRRYDGEHATWAFAGDDPLPHYASDIAAAWTVVERCIDVGPFGYRDVNGLPIATWFMAHFEHAGLWACSATEAAEAICRAALAAVEGRRVERPT